MSRLREILPVWEDTLYARNRPRKFEDRGDSWICLGVEGTLTKARARAEGELRMKCFWTQGDPPCLSRSTLCQALTWRDPRVFGGSQMGAEGELSSAEFRAEGEGRVRCFWAQCGPP